VAFSVRPYLSGLAPCQFARTSNLPIQHGKRRQVCKRGQVCRVKAAFSRFPASLSLPPPPLSPFGFFLSASISGPLSLSVPPPKMGKRGGGGREGGTPPIELIGAQHICLQGPKLQKVYRESGRPPRSCPLSSYLRCWCRGVESAFLVSKAGGGHRSFTSKELECSRARSLAPPPAPLSLFRSLSLSSLSLSLALALSLSVFLSLSLSLSLSLWPARWPSLTLTVTGRSNLQ